MTLMVTDAGLAKAIDADAQGISVKITQVALGSVGYEPEPSATALQNEFIRVDVSGGEKVASNQIHLTATFDGKAEIEAREIGFFLEDGTLFAVESDPSSIAVYKSGSNGSIAIEAFDLIFDVVPPQSITVDSPGDLSFYTANATAVMATAQIHNMRRTLINLNNFRNR